MVVCTDEIVVVVVAEVVMVDVRASAGSVSVL